jgi:chromosome segregation ATPase
MNNDEDTLGWLGLPTPLHMYRQHCRLLENEIQELNVQLRKAREDVFGISQMLLTTQAKNTEFAGYLRQRGGEAAEMRKQIDTLTTSLRASQREAEGLKRIVNEMRPRPTTIV